jgi:hypothetical protein
MSENSDVEETDLRGHNIQANCAFIAHARQDIPALIEEVGKLRGETRSLGRAYDGASMDLAWFIASLAPLCRLGENVFDGLRARFYPMDHSDKAFYKQSLEGKQEKPNATSF